MTIILFVFAKWILLEKIVHKQDYRLQGNVSLEAVSFN